ncbi:hypothetical protein vBEfaHEF1TV_134 [Enterococcus phage vB_EfaH_EF1TV]|nr:hypothetical protein vBEfaHEF1TV_134 [Enterococcus phage vB_EfaH_EF1TV]
MNFQEQLQQQLKQQNIGEREAVDYPSNHLKHKELYFPKAENGQPSTLYVRVLPPAVPGENYNVSAREAFLTTRNRNGKDLKSNFIFSEHPNAEDILEQAMIRWNAENRVPNPYSRNTKPRQRYYVNVVQLIINQQTGEVSYETDSNGQLMVRLLKLPQTACMAINESLSNPMLRPQFSPDVPEEVAQYSFISSADAFPISITKPPRSNKPTSYNVQVISNRSLGALPQGWENLLEDLKYQATPSVEYNREFIEYFIDVVDGKEPVHQGVQSQGTQAPQFNQQPVQPQFNQQPVQPQFNQQPVQPMQQNTGWSPQQSQPQQPATGFNATNMGTPPNINGGFNQQPVQQPVQQQQPMGSFNEQPVTDPSTISDADMPFNMQSMPDVSPQQNAVPEQPVTNTPEPVSQPVVNQQPNNTPSVDDLLAGMVGNV